MIATKVKDQLMNKVLSKSRTRCQLRMNYPGFLVHQRRERGWLTLHCKCVKTCFLEKSLATNGSGPPRRSGSSDLAAALPLIHEGKIKPVVDRVMPLWDAAEAHRVLEDHGAFGKVVLQAD